MYRFLFLDISFFFSRRQQELELKLIEEETANRVEEAIQEQVEERLNSEEIKQEIQKRLEKGRRRLNDEVAVQLEKEKEAALIEARQKEVNIQDESSEYFYVGVCFNYSLLCIRELTKSSLKNNLVFNLFILCLMELSCFTEFV